MAFGSRPVASTIFPMICSWEPGSLKRPDCDEIVVLPSHLAVPRPRESSSERIRAAVDLTPARRGYIIDHSCPLACCGLDAPQNTQSQTRAAA